MIAHFSSMIDFFDSLIVQDDIDSILISIFRGAKAKTDVIVSLSHRLPHMLWNTSSCMLKQVCVEPPSSALNSMLPAFAAHRGYRGGPPT